MHRTRTASHAPARLALAIAAVVLASGVSGCHWFGKKDECELPRPEWRARFLA